MRNTPAHLVALWILTSADCALALESAAPGAPATTATAATAGGAPSQEKPPATTGPVPTEEAARSYAAPGSADGTDPANGAAPSTPASEPAGPPGPGGPAAAATATKPAGGGDDSEPPIVPARDTVGNHLAVGAIGGLIVPFGSIDSNVAASDLLGPGLFLGGDITYGVSRTVMVGAYGEVAMPSGKGVWSSQHVSAIAAGPIVRYHLVQGISFDPWLSFGVGFRRVSSGSESFTGIDWARVQLGGDWYAASRLGIGPVLEASLGTILDSTGTLASKAVDAQFVVGLRIVFDSPGK